MYLIDMQNFRPILKKKSSKLFYVSFVVGIVVLGFLINLATSFIYEGLKEDSPFKQFITSQTKLMIGALIFLIAAIIAFIIFNKLRKDSII